MTEGTRKSQKRPLMTAACLAMAMAIAVAAMAGSAHASSDSGGKGDGGGKDDGSGREKKPTSQGHKPFDAKDFIDRFDGKYPPKDSGGGNGSGSGGGKSGSCSRC